MTRKKSWAIVLLFGVILFFLFGLNPILEFSLHGYIQNKLRLQQESSPYYIKYENLNLNIYGQELQLRGLQVLPDTRDQNPDTGIAEPGLKALKISALRIDGINLSNFLWNKTLDIHTIELDTLNLSVLKRGGGVLENEGLGNGLVLDSLELPGIREIRLGDFRLEYISTLLLEQESGDTLSGFRSSDMQIKGVGMSESSSGNRHTFIPEMDEMVFRLGQQQYSIGEGLYSIRYDSLRYNHREEALHIDGIVMQPELDDEAFAARHPHSYERYHTHIAEIKLLGANLSRLLKTGSLEVGLAAIYQMKTDIFRDKTKPQKTQETSPLPSRSLKDLKFPLSIDTLRILDSSLSYYERLPNTQKHVEVSFEALEAEFRNIRSGKWAMDSKESLEVQLKTDLLGALEVNLELTMPYGRDAIYMEGHTSGSSRLGSLNPTIYPAMKMRFGAGQFDGLTFHAGGTSKKMTGELTMLYSDLEVELFKDDQNKANTLSWIANAVVKHSNPNRRGKTIIAEINVERDPTKGVMNYVWKGIRSGVINTFNPLGKRHTE